MTTCMALGASVVAARIADGLASDGFAVVDGAVTSAIATRYRRNLVRLQMEGAFRQAAIGKSGDKQIVESVRSDQIFWIDGAHLAYSFRRFHDIVAALTQELNRSLYLGIRSCEFHGAVYEEGAFYRRHLDQHRGTPDRIVTVILYLNPQWRERDGGELVMYDETFADGQQVLMPKAGRLVAFLSDRFPHEVLPANRERYSITGWLRRDNGL